jgi:hypothetical protein
MIINTHICTKSERKNMTVIVGMLERTEGGGRDKVKDNL